MRETTAKTWSWSSMTRGLVLAGLTLGAVGCKGGGVPSADAMVAGLEGPEVEEELDHLGPRVELLETGPARWVRLVYNGFRASSALEVVRFLDDRYRTAGSPGYDQSLDEIERRLREAGFGERAGLELRVLESELEQPSWSGEAAELVLETPSGGAALLHAFSAERDPERCMLPEFAPSCEVEGAVALSLDELEEGGVLLTEASPRRDLLQRARRKGAVALVCASHASYNVDPTGRERHLDAIQFRSIDPALDLPVAMISPRSHQRILEALERDGGARLRYTARVSRGDKKVRTLVATVVGDRRAHETVVLPSHILAPGANDNASGAAGTLEAAITLARVLERGGFPRPARSLTFVWGAELLESQTWLEQAEREPVAAVHAVMIGESRSETGAVPLLERTPDPGAVEVIPPDEHSLWGARAFDESWLRPNGLSIIARCALVDVARHAGGWETSENPYEGGTDHDVFLEAGIPAVLFWHFTDFTFHTSLDRLPMVDEEELRRSAVAALCTALSVADPSPGDLDRYLRSMARARRVRVEAATKAERPEVAESWTEWYEGVRQWLRVLCLELEGADADLPEVSR